MPHAIHALLESGILLASVTAVLLNLFFNGVDGDAQAAVAAAGERRTAWIQPRNGS
jgi:NCS2 family nucleobase:cation symporter-2